jgi:hypothetical protein
VKYIDIVSLQGDYAADALDEATAEYEFSGDKSYGECLTEVLKRWETGDESESHEGHLGGMHDSVHYEGPYVCTWSHSFGWCGLSREAIDND